MTMHHLLEILHWQNPTFVTRTQDHSVGRFEEFKSSLFCLFKVDEDDDVAVSSHSGNDFAFTRKTLTKVDVVALHSAQAAGTLDEGPLFQIGSVNDVGRSFRQRSQLRIDSLDGVSLIGPDLCDTRMSRPLPEREPLLVVLLDHFGDVFEAETSELLEAEDGSHVDVAGGLGLGDLPLHILRAQVLKGQLQVVTEQPRKRLGQLDIVA